MNSSGTSRKKRNRKTVVLRCRKLSSASGRSLLSHSRHATATGYKHRISTLSNNNKRLANALQESRQELADVKNLLDASNKSQSKMMFVQGRMLQMHSYLQCFMKDFNEMLQILKHDTKWPTVDHLVKSRDDFRIKFQNINIIEPVDEETSEGECMSFESDVTKCTEKNSKKSSHVIMSFPFKSNTASSEPQIMKTKEVRKGSVAQVSVDDGGTDLKEGNDDSYVQTKTAESNVAASSVHVSEVSILPALSPEKSNELLSTNDKFQIGSWDNMSAEERKVSKTPELHIAYPSLVGLSTEFCSEFCPSAENADTGTSTAADNKLSSVKTICSRIPRIQDLSFTTKKKICSYVPIKMTSIHDKKVKKGTGNSVKVSNVSKEVTPAKNGEILISDTFGEKLSNEKLVSCSSSELLTEGSDDYQHRKTFVVKKLKNVENDEISHDRRKTFVKKSYKDNKNSPPCKNRRDTFTVITNPETNECNSDKESSNVVNSNSAFDTTTQNDTHLLNTNIGTELTLPLVHDNALKVTSSTKSSEEFNNVLQGTILEGTDQSKKLTQSTSGELQTSNENLIHVTKFVEEDARVYCEKNAKEVNNVLLTTKKHSNVNLIHTQIGSEESLINNDNTVEHETCSTVGTAVFHSEIKHTDILQNRDKISTKNSIKRNNEIDEHTNCIIEAKSTVNELENEDDVVMLETFKSRKKSRDMRNHKRISYSEFMSSSDSELEIAPDTDLDFVPDVLLMKDPPIRKHIPKNKPKKVFIFDAKKRKSSLLKKRQSRPKVAAHSLKAVDENNITCHSNDNHVSNINKEILQGTIQRRTEKYEKKKSIRITCDTSPVAESIFNIESEGCENNSFNLNKLAAIEEGTEILSQNNETFMNDENKVKDSCSPKVIISTSCKRIIDSDEVNDSLCNHNDYHVNHNCAKDINNATGEISSNIENKEEKKFQKSKRKVKRKPSDHAQLDDIIPVKKNKCSKKVEAKVNFQKITSDMTIESKYPNTDMVVESKYPKNKTKRNENKSKKKIKEKLPDHVPCKNTIIVHAEIHTPPPFVNVSSNDSSEKENNDACENKRLSVVLCDILQSGDIDKLNISCDTDALSKGQKHLPSKTPLSDHSSNINTAATAEASTEKAHNSNNFEEIVNFGRRRKKNTVSYKEPSMRMKMRR